MPEFAAYAGLFTSAFLSATLLPGSSEVALIALLAAGRGEPLLLLLFATVDNVLGSVVNWAMGRFLSRFRDRRWFPVDRGAYERAIGWFERYGKWSLLLSWLPVIGDPLTVAAGAMRVGFWQFTVLVTLGKAARYAFIAAAYGWWSPN